MFGIRIWRKSLAPDGAVWKLEVGGRQQARWFEDPGFYGPGEQLAALREDVAICKCTNEALEAGRSCEQPHCPNR